MQYPPGWDMRSQQFWDKGLRQQAINTVLAGMNQRQGKKPLPQVLQLCYYIYSCGDYASAAQWLLINRKDYPDNPQLLQNLAVCQGKSRQYPAAVATWQELLRLDPENYLAFDSLSHVYSGMGDYGKAAQAGTRALALKDRKHATPAFPWKLPELTPQQVAGNKKPVIAFSLWGNNPRYLRGAVDNLLAAPAVYPGWVLRFYIDDTVPAAARHALEELGADIRLQPPGQSLRQRLTWRFKVADDKEAGYFLVRDADSLIGMREKRAVDEWMNSDRWFHVMRDWWTHTDLVLAGMWGGVAGVLPSLEKMIARYQPASVATPNIDQWFLRDELWACIRQSCMVHDRCFESFNARPWPGDAPEGNEHVGQDVFSARGGEQEKRLGVWLERLAS